MIKVHSTLKSTTDKVPVPQLSERFYTMGYAPQSIKPNLRLKLAIKGQWLEQIGFYSGLSVIIKIKHGKLIIELAMQI